MSSIETPPFPVYTSEFSWDMAVRVFRSLPLWCSTGSVVVIARVGPVGRECSREISMVLLPYTRTEDKPAVLSTACSQPLTDRDLHLGQYCLIDVQKPSTARRQFYATFADTRTW